MVTDIPKEQQKTYATQKINQRLDRAKQILFSVGVGGQWLFVSYIVGFYFVLAINGQYEKVNEVLGHGVIEGDLIGNLMLGIHIFLAGIIIFGGPLQFFTSIRQKYPIFHRWNGRIYFTTAIIAALAGLYMNSTRGAHGGIPMYLGNALNAVLIFGFSFKAWQSAMKRDFVSHKRWAIRAYLMVCGVWFFRIGYGLWVLLTGFTAIGASPDLTGPFDRFLAFGHSLVPLLILELYFFTKSHPDPRVRQRMAVFLYTLIPFLVAGIVMVAVVFWGHAY